jgi:hypothetical protein
MDELSTEYLKKTYPDRPLPSAFDARVGRALADMEEDRPRTEAEYLARLRVFAAEVEGFVREKGLAGLPEQQTLSLDLPGLVDRDQDVVGADHGLRQAVGSFLLAQWKLRFLTPGLSPLKQKP